MTKQKPRFTKPILTMDKFTADNALRALRSRAGWSGLCTSDNPWGEQITAFLKDGTPVARWPFVYAVLEHLTGNKNAAYDHIKRWERDVREVAVLPTVKAA